MERKIMIRMNITDLPDSISGACSVSEPGEYIVLINNKGTPQQQAAAFLHECLHIWHNDEANPLPSEQIESERHRELKELLRAECLEWS